MKIHFIDVLKSREKEISETIKKFVQKHKLNNELSISITFLSPNKIQKINKQYCKIDKSTDVLSFPIWNNLSEIPSEGAVNLGEIIICPEKTDIEKKLVFLVNHSLKHLIGIHHNI